ncbi:MAG TPA: polysaccharide deacetylase family protein [Candidatus Krumholzibacteria bacterium]
MASLALHFYWRVHFGYPPDTIPRVLCFHKLSRRFLLEGTWTTPRHFTAIVDRLLERGYTFIDESRYLEMLGAPRPGASRCIFLTFDDGYADTINMAHELLAERRVPLHVFLVSDFAGKDNAWDLSLGRPPVRHLDWERVRELSEEGVTFGSHTASHADATCLSYDEFVGELQRSRRDIEAATGKPVRTLSYPFGRCNERCARAARDAGFEAAFSLYPAASNAEIDRYALGRQAVYVIDPVGLVERKLRPNALYGLEEMKCRAINAVAVLTPVLKSRRRPA